MTHAEFNTAFAAGRLRVDVDRKLAAQVVSGRMMLAVFLLPLLGVSVALAMVGHWIIGLVLFLLTFGFRQMVRNSAPGFVVRQALADEKFYEMALRGHMMTITEVDPSELPAPPPTSTPPAPRG